MDTRLSARRTVVSKRHQSSRRKSYGRRQHEVRERSDRVLRVDDGIRWESTGDDVPRDGVAFLEPAAGRFRLALQD